jgi:hypothetical protein
MFSRLRRQRRRTAAIVASALAFAVALTCFLQADMTLSGMACCASMEACSGSMASNHDCCRTEPARTDQQVGPMVHTVVPRPASVVAVLTMAEPAGHLNVGFGTALEHGSPPTARGVPAHLLLSIIRV